MSLTRLAAVLGWPVEHSRSPAMHNAALAEAEIDAHYLALPTPPDELSTVVRALSAVGALGASVTVPHKQAVMASCDEVHPIAARIGAVNTLCFDSGRVIGHNTDAQGFVDSLREDLGRDPKGARAVLLGGGGAARAVAAGLEQAGASLIGVVARTPSKLDWHQASPWTPDAMRALFEQTDLLVDCTSIGLSEQSEAGIPAPIPIDALAADAAVATLVYHRETALLAAARARGLATMDGEGMLIHQGARAFELWTGVAPSIDSLRRGFRGAGGREP